MTDVELSALEAKAKAATPGPWETKEGPDFSEILANSKNIALVGSQHKDAAYIATANPAVVLELIKDLRQARKERDWLAEKLESNTVCCLPENEECGCSFCSDCGYCTYEGWLNAAKEAVCQK